MSRIFIFTFLFLSFNVFANTYCSTVPNEVDVSLDQIYIPPGASVGTVISKSSLVKKTTTCNAPYSQVAYTSTRENIPTNVTVDYPTNIPGAIIPDTPCYAMESGFPGLGIAWFNYNAGTNLWVCASIYPAGEITRGLSRVGTVDIYDQIVLVKTGEIGNGSGYDEKFDFNKNFIFEERKANPPTYLPNNGPLYKLTLKGNTTIKAPVCTVGSGTNSYSVPVKDMVQQEYTTSEQVIDVSCIGVIENGSNSIFYPISNNGIFSLNSNYFATTDPNIGMSISYSVNDDPSITTIKPNDKIKAIINNNKGVLKLKYTPYIVNGSGDYPLIDNFEFDFNINNKEQNN